MSLRGRLALVTVAVAAVGLVAVSIVVPRLVRGFLVDRLDQQIRAMQAPATGALLGDQRAGGGFGRGLVDFSGVYAVLLDASGKTVAQGFLRTPANPVQPPRLPDASQWTMGSRFDVGSRGTGRAVAYRVRVDSAPGGGTLAVAVPLTDVNDTIGRLIFVEVIVGAVALAAVAALAWWLTGLGLRPLRRIEDTAESIAATGLGQRIQETSPRTEVGRLGRSLNTMLGRIEDAFARQAATEATLRRFVADASHELRTPLTSIRGYAELYHRGGGAQAEQVERSMTRIEEEALRMSDLVGDLLLLARLDEGRPLDREAVDLADVAAKVVADAPRRRARKGHLPRCACAGRGRRRSGPAHPGGGEPGRQRAGPHTARLGHPGAGEGRR